VVKALDFHPTKSGMAYVGNAISDVFCVSVCPCYKSTASQATYLFTSCCHPCELSVEHAAKTAPVHQKSPSFCTGTSGHPLQRGSAWQLRCLGLGAQCYFSYDFLVIVIVIVNYSKTF